MFDFELFIPYIEIIFPISLVIAIMLLLVPIMDKKYVAKARYYIWFIIAIRLLLPFDFLPINESQYMVNATIPDYSIIRYDVLDYTQQNTTDANDNLQDNTSDNIEKPILSDFPIIRLHSVIKWVWIFVSVGLLTFFTVQYIFAKIKFKKRSLPDKNCFEIMNRLCDKMGIKGNLKVYRCRYVNTAMIMGIFSPAIFIPDMDMPDSLLEMILRHELTHYKRKDILYKFVLMLTCCVYWFNPLVWLMDKQAQKDVEICCDNDVISGHSDEFKQQYSESILNVVKSDVMRRTAFSTCFSVSKEDLISRFKNIYDTSMKYSGKSIIFSVLILCIASTLFISCSGDFSSQDYIHKTSSILSNNNKNIFIAEDEEFIYFKDAVKIKKMSKSDDTVTELYTFDASIYEIPTDLEYVDGRIYVFTTLGNIVSMDTNGENILKEKIPDELINSSIAGSKYISENNLYYVTNRMYRIDSETLTFEPIDTPINTGYIAKDGTVFVTQRDGDYLGLYKTNKDGEFVLFSDNNEGVWSSHINYTDSYVFYVAWEKGDFNKYSIYRVDLSGENKTLIKEVPLNDVSSMIKFDNSYIYIAISQNELIKVHKETLEETDISVSAQSYISSVGEVSEGKLFETINSCYYIDLNTGEKVNLSSYGNN